jgi:CO dehydrogenase maturation factor
MEFENEKRKLIMSFSLAITGKGGVGKTTLSALIVKWLSENGKKPILAIDADPNSNLNDALGVQLTDTIGNIREGMKVDKIPHGLSKQEFVEYKINTSLVEVENFDLIAMGRPEGPGCYCYANNVLKEAIGKLSKHYAFLVMDNEAGLENLSRRIMQQVNLMIIVTDPTIKGIKTARRIKKITEDLKTPVKQMGVVVNQLESDGLSDHLKKAISDQGLGCLGTLPRDPLIYKLNERGSPLMDIDASCSLMKSINALMQSFPW